jgi:hypothetical protein
MTKHKTKSISRATRVRRAQAAQATKDGQAFFDSCDGYHALNERHQFEWLCGAYPILMHPEKIDGHVYPYRVVEHRAVRRDVLDCALGYRFDPFILSFSNIGLLAGLFILDVAARAPLTSCETVLAALYDEVDVIQRLHTYFPAYGQEIRAVMAECEAETANPTGGSTVLNVLSLLQRSLETPRG